MAAAFCSIAHATLALNGGAVIILEAIEYQLGEVAGLGSLAYALLQLANGEFPNQRYMIAFMQAASYQLGVI